MIGVKPGLVPELSHILIIQTDRKGKKKLEIVSVQFVITFYIVALTHRAGVLSPYTYTFIKVNPITPFVCP